MIEEVATAGLTIAGIKKLDETLKSTFLGDLVLPWVDVSKAKAQAKILDIKAESLRKNIDLPIRLEDESGELDISCTEELLKRAENMDTLTKIYKQKNRDAVMSHAVHLLENETDVNDDPVDPDWMFMFIDCASNIAKEEMQELWGKVLAGEVKKPNSYSRRTLESLKNLSSKEAKLFEYICSKSPLLYGNPLLLNYHEFLEKHGITFSMILQLADCGLLNDSSLIQTDWDVLDKEKGVVVNVSDKYILLFRDMNKIKIKKFNFTSQGAELHKLLSSETDFEVISDLAKTLQKNKITPIIKLFKIESKNGNYIHYDTEKNLLD